MSEPFIGEIRIFANSWVPYGWSPCNGDFLPISQFQLLFSVISITYGGNGKTTFAVPNLSLNGDGHLPVGTGAKTNGELQYRLGQTAGANSVVITETSMAAHTHSLQGVITGNVNMSADPAANKLSRYLPPPPNRVYTTASNANCCLSAKSVTAYGGSQAHENRQPFLAMNYYIAWDGIYPLPAT